MGELIDQMYLMQQGSSQCFFSENWLQMDLMPRRYNAPTANVVAAVVPGRDDYASRHFSMRVALCATLC